MQRMGPVDQAMIEGLQAGDEAAVASLLQAYWAPAYRAALGLTGESHAAEDVAQETFVRVLQAAQGFEAGRAFRPWFFKILANAASDRRRGEQRRRAREARALQAERISSRAPGGELDLSALLLKHLQGISPKLREALTLRYLEGHSLADAAQALEIPEGTVSSRVRRGLEALRESLRPALQPSAAPLVLVDLLRESLRGGLPSAPSAGQVVAEALAAPLLGGGAAAIAGPLPPVPEPQALLGLAKGVGAAKGAGAAQAVASGGASAKLGATLAVLAAIGLTGGSLVALRPDAGGGAALVSSASAPAPAAEEISLGAGASLEVLAPAQLTVGDEVWIPFSVEGPWAALVDLEPEAVTSAELRVLSVKPEDPLMSTERSARWVVGVRAEGPGQGRLTLRVGTLSAEELVVVRPGGRRVELVHNVELWGPEEKTSLDLDPRVSELSSPRALRLRVIPNLAAEVDLSLRGFSKVPTGCFEQTTAATYPSALVLELAAGDASVDPELVEQARQNAELGSQRLVRFQHSGGAFSIQPDSEARPWLTAVGLEELSHLARVIHVDQARIARAARALMGYQRPSGCIPTNAEERSDLAVTAYSICSLAGAELPPDPQRELAVERGLRWLGEQARGPKASTYEVALAVKALQARQLDASELLGRLREAARSPEEGHVYWPQSATLTRTLGVVAAVEVTALAAQVFAKAGEQELVSGALRWLASRRTAKGFGGTQATVQALEAFRLGNRQPGAGQLEVALGRSPLAPVEISPEAGLREALLSPHAGDPEVGLREALRGGVELRYRGQGRVRAQLAVEGTVPWDASGWDAEVQEGVVSALRLKVQRPPSSRQGVAQRWLIRVHNQSAEFVFAPMVEVSVPVGFELQGRGDLLDGGLEACVEAGTIGAWEFFSGRLVLYLSDMAPEARVDLSVSFVPTLAGSFSGGVMKAYPYYQPSGGVAEAAPEVEVLRRGEYRLSGRSQSAAAEARSAEGAESEGAESEGALQEAQAAQAAPAAPPLRVSWDPALGPLDLSELEAAGWPSPLRRLLSLAVRRGVSQLASATQERGGRSWVFSLRPATWSTGQPVTADDFTRAWVEAKERLSGGGAPLWLDPAQEALLRGLEWEIVGVYALRVRLPVACPELPQRLSSYPFLPSPPPSSDPEAPWASLGPYRIAQISSDRVELHPRELSANLSAVIIESGLQGGADLLWSGSKSSEAVRSGVWEAYEGTGVVGVVSPLREGPARWEWARALRHALVRGGAWSLEGVIFSRRARERAGGDLKAIFPDLKQQPQEVECAREALRPLVNQLNARLRGAGRPVGGLLVSGLQERQCGVVQLGRLRSPLWLRAGGRGRGASLDRNGFLEYPLRVTAGEDR